MKDRKDGVLVEEKAACLLILCTNVTQYEEKAHHHILRERGRKGERKREREMCVSVDSAAKKTRY